MHRERIRVAMAGGQKVDEVVANSGQGQGRNSADNLGHVYGSHDYLPDVSPFEGT